MLYRYILVSHLLRLVLRMDQRLVKILAHKLLPALHLRALAQCFLCTVHDNVLVNPHLLHKLQDQAVVLGKKRIQKMLLLDLLIAVFHCCTLTVLDCLDRLLRKFIYIHSYSLLLKMLNR